MFILAVPQDLVSSLQARALKDSLHFAPPFSGVPEKQLPVHLLFHIVLVLRFYKCVVCAHVCILVCVSVHESLCMHCFSTGSELATWKGRALQTSCIPVRFTDLLEIGCYCGAQRPQAPPVLVSQAWGLCTCALVPNLYKLFVFWFCLF